MAVDAIGLGRFVRAVRHRLGLRQADLAVRARVSASAVSRIERGQLRAVSWAAIERVCGALEIALDLRPNWRGFEGHRLLDADHAAMSEVIVRILRAHGWYVLVEYTFNHYGERGSVDILAWHPATRSLLIIEVKTQIVDVQALVSSVDRKVRVVPGLVRAERGWIPVNVGRVLVVRDARATRTAVERHSAIFAAAFPQRTSDAWRWFKAPAGNLGAVLFLANSRLVAVMRARRRIRHSARGVTQPTTHDRAGQAPPRAT